MGSFAFAVRRHPERSEVRRLHPAPLCGGSLFDFGFAFAVALVAAVPLGRAAFGVNGSESASPIYIDE